MSHNNVPGEYEAALLAAALDYAARGWPVFPCAPENKRPLLARDKDATGKPIKGSGGVSKASTEPEQIRAWWRKWPRAMIGLAMGHDRLFALDFDPRHDAETGEVWTLDGLKADLLAQMASLAADSALPVTLASVTQSGGVHLWLRWPDDGGAPITNRGNLPEHVDVRGLGGYIIAPPSMMASGRGYRWLRGAGPDGASIADAPAALIDILRSDAKRPPAQRAADGARGRQDRAPPERRGVDGQAVNDAQRRWALAALDAELAELRATPVGGGRHGGRNEGTFHAAFTLGQIVAAGALSESLVRAALLDAIKGFGSDHSDAVENGLARGQEKPRDLSEVGQRAGRGPSHRHDARRADAAPQPPHARPAARAPRGASAPFHTGRVEIFGEQPEGVRWRLRAMAADWLHHAARATDWNDAASRERLAWGIGRRCAAALFGGKGVDVSPARWPWARTDGDQDALDALGRSFDAGMARGFDIAPMLLTLRCAALPLTDFGIAERFNLRFGGDYRFTTAKGWLGWDERRWAVLDQDKDNLPAEVIDGVFRTVRAIQEEARAIKASGDGPHGLDRFYMKGKQLRSLAQDVAEFGRKSETAGRPVAIAKLSQKWLTVPIERFDCEPLAVNVLNGTLRLRRESVDGRRRAWVDLEPHRREDLNTRLAPVEYDPEAHCGIYDDFFAWAQPDEAVRRYLRQVLGYTLTGHTGEQKLWFHYGRGANGKSTAFDIWAHVAGDYAGTIGIETFLDQGIKKRGEQASPDLARLGGVRFLRASEPERGAKLNEALIKAATGGEPMAVRALHRGFFDLLPLFKLHIAGNYKPDIPGTDEGIWRRMKLVPWDQHRAEHERDEQLGAKLRDEAAGVFRWMIAGALDWLENGLIEPEAVTAATAEYRDDSDPLARFLKMCTEADPSARVQSSRLHEVYSAWCRVAGESEWKAKGFAKAMKDKGWKSKVSNGVQWLGLRLTREVGDFVDSEGRVRAMDEEGGSWAGGSGSGEGARVNAPPDDDPDFVPF